MHGAARCYERTGSVRDRSQPGRYRCPAKALHGSPAGRRDPAPGGSTLQAVCTECEAGAVASFTTEWWHATPFSAGGCAIQPWRSFTIAGHTLDGTKRTGTAAAHYLSVCLQLPDGGDDHGWTTATLRTIE